MRPSVEPRLASWWLEQALAAEGGTHAAPPLAGDVTADVAIVGGGYTGLWTAVALRERDPGLRVSLFERPERTHCQNCQLIRRSLYPLDRAGRLS